MEEIWKDIPEYEGVYQISSFGRIKSLPRKYKNINIKKEIIKVPTKARGYLRIGLAKNGGIKYYSVHRLVAEMFIPNIENKPCVNHKDCNRQNNCVDNLEWCTYKENNNYKNHNVISHISRVIYYLKKDYSENTDIIELAQQLKTKIKNL